MLSLDFATPAGKLFSYNECMLMRKQGDCTSMIAPTILVLYYRYSIQNMSLAPSRDERSQILFLIFD